MNATFAPLKNARYFVGGKYTVVPYPKPVPGPILTHSLDPLPGEVLFSEPDLLAVYWLIGAANLWKKTAQKNGISGILSGYGATA